MQEYPLQKKHQLPTYTRELPHLRPRTEVILAVLRLRDKATRAFNEYFEVSFQLFFLFCYLIYP
jgi:aspartyl/asparaginyl-tRNA synthetase